MQPSTRTGSLLLDGAMGTSLREHGLAADALPEEWLASRPGEVGRVHAAQVAAGARMVLTCTFNLASPRLVERGLSLDRDVLARAAVGLARRAGAEIVAGAVGPTGMVRPGGAARPARRDLEGWYLPSFGALAAAGADVLWAETQYDLEEARAALAAARATGVPCAVTLAFRSGASHLPGGEPVLDALATLAADGAAAVGVGCVEASTALVPLVAAAARLVRVPVIAKPSAGLPGAVLGPEEFAARAVALARAGATWIGGCCGAGAAHLAALAAALGAPQPRG